MTMSFLTVKFTSKMEPFNVSVRHVIFPWESRLTHSMEVSWLQDLFQRDLPLVFCIFDSQIDMSTGQVEIGSESGSQDGTLTDTDSSNVLAVDGIMFNVMTSRHVTGFSFLSFILIIRALGGRCHDSYRWSRVLVSNTCHRSWWSEVLSPELELLSTQFQELLK